MSGLAWCSMGRWNHFAVKKEICDDSRISDGGEIAGRVFSMRRRDLGLSWLPSCSSSCSWPKPLMPSWIIMSNHSSQQARLGRKDFFRIGTSYFFRIPLLPLRCSESTSHHVLHGSSIPGVCTGRVLQRNRLLRVVARRHRKVSCTWSASYNEPTFRDDELIQPRC